MIPVRDTFLQDKFPQLPPLITPTPGALTERRQSVNIDTQAKRRVSDVLAVPAGVVAEHDPHGVDRRAPGAKLDSGKVCGGLLDDFALALLAVAEVGTFGANKYSRGGWQAVPNGEQRYRDAMWRHLLKERHEERDTDSGLRHAAHRAWNALAELELCLRAEARVAGR